MIKYLSIICVTLWFFCAAANSNAQDLNLPTLDLPEGYVPKEKKEPTKLPTLAEPKMKNLTDSEKKAINNVVDSIFEKEAAANMERNAKSENRPEQQEESEQGAGKTITVNVNTGDNDDITVTVEEDKEKKEVVENKPVTTKSILDSKEEAAEKSAKSQPAQVSEKPKAPAPQDKVQDVKEASAPQEDKNVEQKKDVAEQKPEPAKEEPKIQAKQEEVPEEKTKQEIVEKKEPEAQEKQEKLFDTRSLFTKTEEDKAKPTNPGVKWPKVSIHDKPLYIKDDNIVGIRTAEFRKKSPISIDSSDFATSYNKDPVYDSLERIRKLPLRNKKVKIKSDIVIDRGNFQDPFYDELEELQDDSTEKVEEEFSLNEYDLSSIEQPLDINNVKRNKTAKKVPAKKPQNFHIRDKDLIVEVKSIDRSTLKYYKNAKDALSVGQYESAITYFKQLLKKKPNDPKILFGLATAYHKAKQYDNARKAYLETIKLGRDYWPAVNNYLILISEEFPENAEERLKNLWFKNPDFASIPAQLGNLNYEKRNYSVAAEYYSKAVSLDPKNYNYQYNFAVILEKMGDKTSAARVYRKILESPTDGYNLPENKIDLQRRYYQLLSDNG